MNVLVLGDPVLDWTRYGTSTRRSPESGRCLVLVENRQEWTLGGAANVARWLAADPTLTVTLIAPYGRDDVSNRLRALCEEAGVRLSARLFDPAISVTVKERLMLEDTDREAVHHLLRVDRDVVGEVRRTDLGPLRHDLNGFGRYDAIVAVDYGKFVFRGDVGMDIRECVSRAPCVRIVNSKHPRLWQNTMCHLLVCNQQEMVDAFDIHNPPQVRKLVAAHCLVVTRGAGGVTAVLKEEPIHRLTLTTNLVDVCGAGDAFTAGLAQAALHHTVRGLERLQPVALVDILDNAQRSAAHCCSQLGCGNPLVPRER